MIEKDLQIELDDCTLSATVCMPEGTGSFPSVLMTHGSGPLDRNENIKGQRLDVFNALAHYLADRGIASLRYDKRGCGKSSGDYHSAGHFDLVEDAVGAYDVLVRQDFCDADRAYVLGHSEGCIIAPQVGAVRPSVAGLVLLCPFVGDMESILIKQATQIEHELNTGRGFGGTIRKYAARLLGFSVANQRKLIARLRSTDDDHIRVKFQKVPAKWFRELLLLDSAEIMGQNTCPMLMVGGEKDLQCDPDDVERIASLTRGPVHTHVVRNLTHVLRFDEDEASVLKYGKLIKKPIEPMVLELVSDWLTAQS